MIEAGGDPFLAELRVSSYEECKNFLLNLPGIGNKVSFFDLLFLPIDFNLFSPIKIATLNIALSILGHFKPFLYILFSLTKLCIQNY